MSRLQQFILIVLPIIIGVFPCFDALHAQSEVKGKLADVGRVSDSVLTVLAEAVTHRDSVMLSSVFIDSIDILMPGNIPLRGKAAVVKHLPLFLEKAGSGKLTTSRSTLDLVPKKEDMACETGRYELTRATEQGAGKTWKGNYIASWRLHEKTWVLSNLLLSKD